MDEYLNNISNLLEKKHNDLTVNSILQLSAWLMFTENKKIAIDLINTYCNIKDKILVLAALVVGDSQVEKEQPDDFMDSLLNYYRMSDPILHKIPAHYQTQEVQKTIEQLKDAYLQYGKMQGNDKTIAREYLKTYPGLFTWSTYYIIATLLMSNIFLENTEKERIYTRLLNFVLMIRDNFLLE